QLPEIDKGLFSWIRPSLSVPESLLIERIGLDAAVFLRFIVMCRNIFFWLFLLGFIVIIPINVYGTKQDQGTFPETMNPIEYLSITFLKAQKWLVAHTIFTWVFSFIVYYHLYKQYREFAELKQDYFKSTNYQDSLHSRTLMVLNIPPAITSEQELGDFIESLKLDHPISQMCIGHRVGDLPTLVKEHDHAVRELEKILCKYFKGRPTHLADVMDRVAHSAAKHIRHRLAAPKLILAPLPKDIVWNNLPLVGTAKGEHSFGFVKTKFIATDLDLKHRSTKVDWLCYVRWPMMSTEMTDTMTKHWVFVALMESWITPFLMSVFFVILPILLRTLARFQGKITESSLERSTLARLYLFFLLNNVIIFTAFTTIYDIATQIKAIIDSGDTDVRDFFSVLQNSNLLERIIESIIRVSTFWINYISLRGAGTLIELAQFAVLLIKKIKILLTTETPRNKKELSRPPDFKYAVYYNLHLFIFTIVMLYSVIAPVILIFCLLYFELAYLTYKYQLIFVYTTKAESGGTFWRVLFNRMIISTIFWQLVMIGVINMKGAHFQSIVLIPLPVMTVFLKILCSRSFDAKIHYYTPDRSSDTEVRVNANKEMEDPYHQRDKISIRFGHPALMGELIKPMLSSSHKIFLDKIYDGRMEDVEGEKHGRLVKSTKITAGTNVIEIVTVDDSDLNINEEYMEELKRGYYYNYEATREPLRVQEE
ncbi:3679_t:CDS:2, partial [Acaulospora colombiana]